MFEHYDILDAPIKKKVVASVWATVALVFYVLLTARLCSLFIQDGIDSGVIDVDPKLAAESLKSLLVLGVPGILAILISLIRKERWGFEKRIAVFFSVLIIAVFVVVISMFVLAFS